MIDEQRSSNDEPVELSERDFARGRQSFVVDIDNLWVSYGRVRAVQGIKIQIPKGEVFGFIGPNGAGKINFVRHIFGSRKKASSFNTYS